MRVVVGTVTDYVHHHSQLGELVVKNNVSDKQMHT